MRDGFGAGRRWVRVTRAPRGACRLTVPYGAIGDGTRRALTPCETASRGVAHYPFAPSDLNWGDCLPRPDDPLLTALAFSETHLKCTGVYHRQTRTQDPD